MHDNNNDSAILTYAGYGYNTWTGLGRRVEDPGLNPRLLRSCSEVACAIDRVRVGVYVYAYRIDVYDSYQTEVQRLHDFGF